MSDYHLKDYQIPCKLISECPISNPHNSACASGIAEYYFPDKPATCFAKIIHIKEEQKREKRRKLMSKLLRIIKSG